LRLVLPPNLQALTVYATYDGQWSALFCIGGEQSQHSLTSGLWTFPGSRGYDGQWYRLVARDPWLETDVWRSIDDPRLRYRRILIPGIAWALGLAQPEWIDAAYFVTVIGLIFLGVYFTAEWIREQGQPPWLAAGFAIMPGTLISIDRMVVDIGLYTCIAAALLFWRRRNWIACWLAGMLAFLDREIGLLLITALVLASLHQRAWRRAAVFATAAGPAAIWFLWVAAILPPTPQLLPLVPDWVLKWPIIGPFRFILRPPEYLFDFLLRFATQTLDRLLIVGIIIGSILAIREIWRKPWTLDSLIMALYVPIFLFVSTPRFWADPYASARAFTPMVTLLAWRGLVSNTPTLYLPAGLMLLRTVWQLGPQFLGVIRAGLS
jgi:hypothetical protein